MLSDVCFDTKRKCSAQYNRTHDLPYPAELDNSVLETKDKRLQDWLNGPIPRRHPQALTGTEPDVLASELPKQRVGQKRGKKERSKRKKGKGSKGKRLRRLAPSRGRWAVSHSRHESQGPGV